MGDYFVTGGNDSVVLTWESNLNNHKTEDLSEMKAKIETEVFITQKEKVDKLPSSRGTKMGKGGKENFSKLANNADDLEPTESVQSHP